MSRCAIFCDDDREFYCGLDIGWSKQLRLAKKVHEARFWRAEARRLRRGIYHGSFCALPHDHDGECKL